MKVIKLKNLNRTEIGLFVSIVIVISLVSGILTSFLVFNALGASSNQPIQENYFELTAYISGYKGTSDNIKDKINPDLVVSPNSNITIKLIAGETLVHDFIVDKYYENESASEVSTLTNYKHEVIISFFIDSEGVFTYYCSIPGHFNSMHGNILVGTAQVSKPEPAKQVTVNSIIRKPTNILPPVGARQAKNIEFTLITQEVIAEIEPGTTMEYFTFNGSIPGPLLRVRVYDNVTIHLVNEALSMHTHSIDLHAATDNGGGAAYTQVAPGETKSFSFNASHEGVFVYHCASTHVPTHISLGMYGAISVEPASGLPAVDKEFYVGQSEAYTKWPAGTLGHQVMDSQKMLSEDPTYVLFNGKAFGLTDPNYSLNATKNDNIRIFFSVGGPNIANIVNAETVVVPPGSAIMIQMNVEKVGKFILVDHALTRAFDKGAIGYLYVNS